jgi:hypothetical protein
MQRFDSSDEAVRVLVGQLLQALGVSLTTGQVTLHLSESLVQQVETRTFRRLRRKE